MANKFYDKHFRVFFMLSGKIVKAEESSTGSVGLSVYKKFAKAGGGEKYSNENDTNCVTSEGEMPNI